MLRSQERIKLSNPRRRVLLAIRDLGGEHVTINQLSAHLGGHPNASRAHLTALADRGLITVADIPGTGPGRRPRGHTITTKGSAALDPSDAGNASLTGAFASYLVRNGHDTDTSDPVDAVVRVLDMLGFDPGRVRTADGDALVLRSCPLVGNDHDDQAFLCDSHHGLIDGVLRRIGAAEGLTLLPLAATAGSHVQTDEAVAL